MASLLAGSSGSKARFDKLAPEVRVRLATSEAERMEAEIHVEEMEEEIENLKEHLDTIEKVIGKSSGGSLLPNRGVVEAAVAAISAKGGKGGGGKKKRKRAAAVQAAAPPTKALYEMLGKTGEAYSQDIIELGLTLMAAQLTAPQAVSVMRAFIRAEYPEKKEGVDFRIPDASRFREWRRYLEPISHYIGVSVLSLSVKSHLLHDATTKNHVHVFQTCFRCELKGSDGEPVIVDVPLKFEICPSGKKEPEADLSVEAMTSPLADKPAASMVNVASASSDGAARGTSREFGERKKEELEKVQELVDNDVRDFPEKYKAAVSAYLSLTEEQREVADEFHELGCSGHALNLIVEDSWKQSEKQALSRNMANHGTQAEENRNGSSELPDTSNVVNCTSKLFSSSGKHWDYYLNEHRRVEKFARENNLQLQRLPAVQGSRQCINVQLATAILANKATYLKYMSEIRAESDPNKLVGVVWDGLRNRYVVAALRARSFVDVTYAKTMTFFTHSSTMNRLMLRTAVDCGGKYIDKLSHISRETSPPSPGSLGDAIMTALKQLPDREGSAVKESHVESVQSAYDSWWQEEKESLERSYAECTDAETWKMVAHHLESASPYMAATHCRGCNIDDDFSKVASLEHAPINTDVVESGFAHFDDALKIKASVKAMIGVAHAKALKAFSTDGEKKEKAMQTARKMMARGSGSSSLSNDAAALVEKWNVTSFFNFPREKRWMIIKSVQKNYKELCVDDPKTRLEKHDEAALERSRQARLDEINKARGRWLRYKQMESIQIAKSASELNDIYSSFSDEDDKARNEAMIDQIRVRIHVYALKAMELPKMHSELDYKGNAARLRTALKPVVEKPLPPKPGAPSPFPERPHHSAPTDEATQLQEDYMREYNQAWKEVMEITQSGSFIAPKRKARGGGLGAPRKRRRGRATKERSARDDEIALVGEEFEEDGVQWKVLAVDWSDDDASMVVWYYDVQGANLSEEEMDKMRVEGTAGNVDALEFSSVSEVKEWVKLCKAL